MIRDMMAFWFLLQGFSNCSGNNLVQAGRRRRPQVVVQVCVFGVRWRARTTHKLVQRGYLRRSRNMSVSIAPTGKKPPIPNWLEELLDAGTEGSKTPGRA